MTTKAGAAAPVAGAKPGEAAGAADVQVLQKKIEELTTANAKMTGMMETMLLNEEPEQPVQGKPETIPDPVGDPKGYAAYVGKQVQAGVSGVKDELNQQRGIERVWEQFKSKHKELAEHEELVESMAARELREMQRAGVKDPVRAMLSDPKEFIDKLAAKVKSKVDAIRGKKEGDEEAGEPEGAGFERTEGVLGMGLPPAMGGAPAGRQPKVSNFADEVKAMQANLKGVF